MAAIRTNNIYLIENVELLIHSTHSRLKNFVLFLFLLLSFVIVAVDDESMKCTFTVLQHPILELAQPL